MWLFIVFVTVPIIEIALFIQIGGAIGLWATLAIVVLTAGIGTSLVRTQGMSTLGRLQSSLTKGGNPAEPIAQGAIILIAGILLLTPGFFTDAVGFAFLVPPFRRLLIRWITARILLRSRAFSTKPTRPNESGQTINGEFSVLDAPANPADENPSGWTKH